MTGKMSLCSSMSVLAFLTILPGCGIRRAYNKKYYVLNAVRQAQSVRTEIDSILDVRRFTIDSAFGGKGLVYRTGEFAYESDFYSEFLVSPAAMITDKTRNWLSKAGLFGTVLEVGSQVDPTHVIEGNITALYGDFRDKSSHIATMEIRIFLLKVEAGGESVPVFSERYPSAVGIESEDSETLVKGFDKCLQNILSSLEKDLSQQTR